MKKVITTIVFLITCISYSQDNIVPLEDASQHSSFETPKIYYKDVNGILDKFIGTWKYQDNPTNPTKVFEITFSKREMRDEGGASFTDELTSKFIYVDNSTIVYNTYQDRFGYISGSILVNNTNNSKMKLYYSEPIIDGRTLRENPNSILEIEFQIISGQPQLKWYNGYELLPDNSSPFRIPLLMVLNKI